MVYLVALPECDGLRIVVLLLLTTPEDGILYTIYHVTPDPSSKRL